MSKVKAIFGGAKPPSVPAPPPLPEPPPPPPVAPVADDQQLEEARKRRLANQQARTGRLSTRLTRSGSGDRLGD